MTNVMQRVPLICGNWKMNLVWREARALVEALLHVPVRRDREWAVCPPYVWLQGIKELLDESPIRLGAQDVFWEASGAFTGAVSPAMLKDVGCTYCIIGHSERRTRFGDTDDSVALKLRALLEYGVTPIVCCGETHHEYKEGLTRDVVTAQIARAFHHLTPAEVERTVVAYEPIWAIGTGLADTPENANETMGAIRNQLGRLAGDDAAHRVRILYGGSVNAGNVDAFLGQRHIDGALVGGASLKADSFQRIMEFQSPSTVIQ